MSFTAPFWRSASVKAGLVGNPAVVRILRLTPTLGIPCTVCSVHGITRTACALKAKFHYAIWSQSGPKVVADLSQTC